MMLSQVLRLDLVDTDGERARLHDLIVDLRAGDYPPVTHLVATRRPDGVLVIPWSGVCAFDLGSGSITAPLSEAGEEGPTLDNAILLRRDVRDAVIIDLEARRALLANDLWLEQKSGTLRLIAVDASPWGVVRRLTLGLIDRDVERELFDWRYVEFLRGMPHAPDLQEKHERIARLPPGEIAHLVETLPYLHAAELVRLLPDHLGADVLEAMSPERQLQVFEELDEKLAARLLALMAPDAAADLVGHLQPETARRCLEALPAARRDPIVDLLRYPEDTAGGIMTNELVLVPEGVTVAEARGLLRERVSTPDLVYYAYIVDNEEERHLRGVITLRNVLTADDDQPVEAIMDPYLVTIHPLESAVEAAQRVVDNQLFALPVVGQEGQLVGAITVDSAVSQVAPMGWRNRAPKVFS